MSQTIASRRLRDHPDFNTPWIQTLLDDPDTKLSRQTHEMNSDYDERVSNNMFSQTLATERAVRAQLAFSRPTKEPDSIFPWEECFLFSIGHGVDGATGRAHGGFNSLVMDHITGHCASRALVNDNAPATATLTVDYKAPVDTPSVILARGWVVELSGRKVWVRAMIEDGQGKVLASGKALYIKTKEKL